jgi:hypothetical protein
VTSLGLSASGPTGSTLSHLEGALSGCRAYLAQLRTTKKALVALAEESIPEVLKGQLLTAFRNWKST